MPGKREIDTEFWFRDIVCLRIDEQTLGRDKLVGVVTRITLSQKEEVYNVMWADHTETEHYDFELKHTVAENLEEDDYDDLGSTEDYEG